MDSSQHNLTDNTESKRFELVADSHTAFIEYILTGNKIFFTHTEVPKELEGKGIGSVIVKLALDNIAARELKLIPLCPFVAAYIKRHPEWNNILAQDVTLK